jgi:Cu-Zn family superoxide dismutase
MDRNPTTATPAAAAAVDKAICVLVPVGESKVTGTVRFERQADGKVKVSGEVRGLTPGRHGFHVHEFGDLSARDDGKSVGDHFAGGSETHGRRDAQERHAGDLGNIEAGDDGVAQIDLVDDVLALSGPHSILGRGLVVHADEDKFTQPSGDAGGRVAFGVIGIAD